MSRSCLVNLGHHLFQFVDRNRRAHAGNHVLALGVHQVLAIEHLLARGGIARKAHAGAGGIAHIAENHGLDVHGRSQVVGNLIHAAIRGGAGVVPGAEHSLDRHVQLHLRVLGEVLAGFLAHDFLVVGDHRLQVFGGQVGIELGLLALLLAVENVFELLFGNLHHHVAEHLDEAAIAIVGKAGVAALGGDHFHHRVVHAEVQDGVHHARHGKLGAGADRNQQGILLVAELLAQQFFQFRQRLVLLGEDIRGRLVAV